jgi:EAL domain-containing protein (putative c-di-GMP-specific phosphodiesterase class I)
VHAVGGRIYAYEALLRSRDPALPGPGALLDAAELLDRLEDVGRAVRILVAGPLERIESDALLFVNLHPRDLEDEHLSSSFSPLCRHAERVVFEITERTALETVQNVRGSVEALRAQGYRIAIDDLGAGYSGLSSFTELLPDLVKLDMSLVRGIDSDPARQELVGTMTSACREMGLSIVAEGIETVAERELLVSLGCDLLQGFLFGKPGPAFPDATWP